MIERRIVDPANGFAEAVVVHSAGRTVYLSGNVGFDSDRTVVPGGIESEARATFANLAETLARAGGSREHIVKILAFIVNIDDYAGYAKVRTEFFGDALPASSTVVVKSFVVDARIEIEAVAFIPEPRGRARNADAA
jgi:2-iminobutanoate/2-iminopropanoate deaminase